MLNHERLQRQSGLRGVGPHIQILPDQLVRGRTALPEFERAGCVGARNAFDLDLTCRRGVRFDGGAIGNVARQPAAIDQHIATIREFKGHHDVKARLIVIRAIVEVNHLIGDETAACAHPVKLDVFQRNRRAANGLGRRVFELRDVGLQGLFLMRAITLPKTQPHRHRHDDQDQQCRQPADLHRAGPNAIRGATHGAIITILPLRS